MRRFSLREQVRVLAFVAAAGVIVTIVGMGLIGPAWRKAKELGEQLKLLTGQVRGLEAATAGAETLQQQYQVLERKVAGLQQGLPSENELPAMIELLSGLASQSNVRIQTIFPQRSADDSSVGSGLPEEKGMRDMYRMIPIQIDALAGYHELGAFLSLVESHQKPLRIANLRITGQPKDGKWHRIKLVINAYFTSSAAAGSVAR